MPNQIQTLGLGIKSKQFSKVQVSFRPLFLPCQINDQHASMFWIFCLLCYYYHCCMILFAHNNSVVVWRWWRHGNQWVQECIADIGRQSRITAWLEPNNFTLYCNVFFMVVDSFKKANVYCLKAMHTDKITTGWWIESVANIGLYFRNLITMFLVK